MALKRPLTVRALGWLTTLSACAYFFCVFLAYRPGFKAFSEHFLKYTVLYVYFPVMFLAIYMFTRANMGRWLLKEGQFELALSYSLPRIQPDFWLRSARESLIHRTVALHVYLQQQRYSEGLALIEVEGKTIDVVKKEGLIFVRWAVELALRADNLVLAREQDVRLAGIDTPKPERASALAALADVEIRSKQRAKAQKLIDDAAWCDEDNTRLKLSRAHFLMTFDDMPTIANDALALLREIPDSYFEMIPGQLAQWRLNQWRLLDILEQEPETQHTLKAQILDDLKHGRCDAHTTHLIAQHMDEHPPTDLAGA